MTAAQSFWLGQRLQRASGGETSLLYLSLLSCSFDLSLSPLLFSLLLRLFLIVLLCSPGALLLLHCTIIAGACVCVFVCLCACIRVMDQVAAHLRSWRSFKADIHRCPHCNIILEIFQGRGNAILPFEAANTGSV